MGKKGKNNPTLGRSLIKDRFGSRKPTAESFVSDDNAVLSKNNGRILGFVIDNIIFLSL